MSWSLAVSGAGALLLVAVGGLLTTIGPWYRALHKPSWQPPDWLFGPVWTVILGLAAWSAALAWDAAPNSSARTMIVALFALNGFFHALWSPLFFTLHRPDWALAEVPFLWLSIAALMVTLGPISALASALLAPYLAWVAFAAWLNLAIVRLNGPFA
ncbi:MAG: tryptophan-rich sensory protein [Acetobacteraceae bacterium]